MSHTEEHDNAWIDERMRPRLANADDGCGNNWYERGRFSAWANLREWVVGVEFHRDERSSVVLRIGPLWFAWEFS